MTFANYEEYYKHLVEINPENEKLDKSKINDITKFQFKHVNVFPDYDIKVIQSYFNDRLLNKSIIDTMSYKACASFNNPFIDQDINPYINNISKRIINLISFNNFGCNLELHMAYLYQNNIKEGQKTDTLNNNKFHWKNEPKTIITAYVHLDKISESDSCLSFLTQKQTGTYITMPTTRTGADNWGNNTHLRYKNCELSDVNVAEFQYLGFEEKKINNITPGTTIIVGNNVVHRHDLKVGSNTKMLVLKFRPTKNKEQLTNIDHSNDIFDLPVNPMPY